MDIVKTLIPFSESVLKFLVENFEICHIDKTMRNIEKGLQTGINVEIRNDLDAFFGVNHHDRHKFKVINNTILGTLHINESAKIINILGNYQKH